MAASCESWRCSVSSILASRWDMSDLTAVISFLMDFSRLRNIPASSFLRPFTRDDIAESAGDPGSSMGSKQQEDAGELSQMDAVCEKGNAVNLKDQACPLRVAGLDASMARYLLMEPVGSR